MDSKLIDLFREKVNDNGADFVLHRYRNINGKNQWSIICSAMDWISVVVDEIDVKKLSYKNDNDSSIRVMTFIVCIDVLWEAIRQSLIEKVNEIFAFLQDMSLKNLTSDEKINDKCPPDCHYAFSKLSDVVWGNGYRELVDFRCLQNSIESIADLSACNSPEEVYVVLKAGFFAKNSDLRRQA